jgi:hypothetical protein
MAMALLVFLASGILACFHGFFVSPHHLLIIQIDAVLEPDLTPIRRKHLVNKSSIFRRTLESYVGGTFLGRIAS